MSKDRQEWLENLMKLREVSVPEVSDIMQAELYLNWSQAGYGFGQLSVYKTADGVLMCGNECMSRERVREILVAAARRLADIVVLEDDREDPPSA